MLGASLEVMRTVPLLVPSLFQSCCVIVAAGVSFDFAPTSAKKYTSSPTAVMLCGCAGPASKSSDSDTAEVKKRRDSSDSMHLRELQLNINKWPQIPRPVPS